MLGTISVERCPVHLVSASWLYRGCTSETGMRLDKGRKIADRVRRFWAQSTVSVFRSLGGQARFERSDWVPDG